MTSPPDRLAEARKDRHTMERELGAGGMAGVYLVHDRKVAIRILRPEFARRRAVQGESGGCLLPHASITEVV